MYKLLPYLLSIVLGASFAYYNTQYYKQINPLYKPLAIAVNTALDMNKSKIRDSSMPKGNNIMPPHRNNRQASSARGDNLIDSVKLGNIDKVNGDLNINKNRTNNENAKYDNKVISSRTGLELGEVVPLIKEYNINTTKVVNKTINKIDADLRHDISTKVNKSTFNSKIIDINTRLIKYSNSLNALNTKLNNSYKSVLDSINYSTYVATKGINDVKINLNSRLALTNRKIDTHLNNYKKKVKDIENKLAAQTAGLNGGVIAFNIYTKTTNKRLQGLEDTDKLYLTKYKTIEKNITNLSVMFVSDINATSNKIEKKIALLNKALVNGIKTNTADLKLLKDSFKTFKSDIKADIVLLTNNTDSNTNKITDNANNINSNTNKITDNANNITGNTDKITNNTNTLKQLDTSISKRVKALEDKSSANLSGITNGVTDNTNNIVNNSNLINGLTNDITALRESVDKLKTRLLGAIVFATPNVVKGIHIIDGSSFIDPKLAIWLLDHPIKGFIVDGDTITTPDWRGRFIAAKGGLGITDVMGDIGNDTTATNGLIITGGISHDTGSDDKGIYRWVQIGDRYPTFGWDKMTKGFLQGDAETKPNWIAMSLCIIGTME